MYSFLSKTLIKVLHLGLLAPAHSHNYITYTLVLSVTELLKLIMSPRFKGLKCVRRKQIKPTPVFKRRVKQHLILKLTSMLRLCSQGHVTDSFPKHAWRHSPPAFCRLLTPWVCQSTQWPEEASILWGAGFSGAAKWTARVKKERKEKNTISWEK